MKVSGKQCIGHLPEEIFRGVVAGNEFLSYLVGPEISTSS